MKKFIPLLALFVMACQPAVTPIPVDDNPTTIGENPTGDAYPDLPKAERMTDKGDVRAPKQALDFCTEHKDFEKC